jgi:prepilin-type N-terminal cleavage/methylation domain-containing protein/prepilin-type processing-associated H-X9-DG protein
MNPKDAKARRGAFTLLELLIVLSVIVILLALVVPARPPKSPARLIQCLNHQKQNFLGFIMFAGDHTNQFPWEISTNAGGAMEPARSGDPLASYAAISPYIKNTSQLVCPTDKARLPAANINQLSRSNLSYFVSLDSGSTNSPATQVMTGDRYLAANGKPITSGALTVSSELAMSWTSDSHPSSRNEYHGSLAFADGHVESVKSAKLTSVFLPPGISTNRLAIP